MNCEHVHALVRELPRAEWAAKQLARVEQHAANCAECRALLAAEAQWEAELMALPEPHPPSSITAVVLARTAAMGAQHAKAPTHELQFVGDAAKSIGIAIGLGAHLFRLLERGTMPGAPEPSIGRWIESFVAMPVLDPITLVLAGGLLIYLFGLFVPLRSVSTTTSGKAIA